jgi:GntR family transcriptional regulator, transcriptional repressor for pyruvate dehydrogenase complex
LSKAAKAAQAQGPSQSAAGDDGTPARRVRARTPAAGRDAAAAQRPLAQELPGDRADKVSEIIARQIVRDIASGRYQPGTRLPPEAVMLDRFRVGRASLREALRIVEVYGLITIRPGPGGGPVVQDVTARQFARTGTFYFHLHGATFRDLLEARRELEPMMARLAATNAGPEALERLQTAVTETGQAFEDSNMPKWRRNTSQFHSLIAGISGNHILDLFGRSLNELYSDRLEARVVGKADRPTVLAEHSAIATAIIERRPAEAERLMAEHMETFTTLTMRLVSGLLDDVLDWR